ncbi:hypothetical protein [Streptococcus suis]
MVLLPMKSNLFTEKMTALKIINLESGQLLGSLNNLNMYPTSVPLAAEMDFFNVRPNTNYILTVNVYFPDGSNYPVHATRVNIPSENLSFLTPENYGKANGSFIFNLTLNYPSDLFLHFVLINEMGESVDDIYSYHGFGRW